MRIAMLTFAVPWAERPTNGLYNIAQARALNALGATTEVFSVAPLVPGCMARLGGAVRRQLARPSRYEWDGVRVHTVRAPAAFPKQVRKHVVPRWPRATSEMFARLVGGPLSRKLVEFDPDALIVHGMQPWGAFASAYAQRHETQLAYIEHSQGDVMRIEQGSALHHFARGQGASAQATLAVNDQMCAHLEALGVPRVRQILNGVNVLEDLPRPNTDPERPFRVLCAGAYYPRKGHRELLDGFARANLPNAELVLVGHPPQSVRSEIEKLGLAERVRSIPLLPNADLLTEMAHADLFALPSWSEAFGLVFMESLGAGTPVLMTQDCGAARHLTHGRHGWIVPPRDPGAIALALEAAGNTPDTTRDAMGQAGRRLVQQRFTWTQNAESMLRALFGAAELPASQPFTLARTRHAS